jgi:hypothetical protein
MLELFTSLYVLNSLVNELSLNAVRKASHEVHTANVIEHKVYICHRSQVLPFYSKLITTVAKALFHGAYSLFSDCFWSLKTIHWVSSR